MGAGELTCVGADVDRLGADAAVDLDVLLGEARAELGDLGDAALEELLAAATCAWEDGAGWGGQRTDGAEGTVGAGHGPG